MVLRKESCIFLSIAAYLLALPAIATTDLDGDGDIDINDFITEQGAGYDPGTKYGQTFFTNEGLTSLDGLENYINAEMLYIYGNQIDVIKSNTFSGMSNIWGIQLGGNQTSQIANAAFSGMEQLENLSLGDDNYNSLNLSYSSFRDLSYFRISSISITSVDMSNASLSQLAFNTLMTGGQYSDTGISELTGVSKVDLSGIDFLGITDISSLFTADDIAELFLLNVTGIGTQFNDLFNNDELSSLGEVFLTQEVYDALGTAIINWEFADVNHVVTIIPEPVTLVLFGLGSLLIRSGKFAN